MPKNAYQEAIEELNKAAQRLDLIPFEKAKENGLEIMTELPGSRPGENFILHLRAHSIHRCEGKGDHQFRVLLDNGRMVTLNLEATACFIHDREILRARIGSRPQSIQHGGLSIE